MPRLRALLFDFDFTLADSTAAALECYNYALVRLGFPPADREMIRRSVGYPIPIVLARLTGVEDPAAAEMFRAEFRTRADEIMVPLTTLFDTVPQALAAAKEEGLLTAIVSNKQRYRIESILAQYDAARLFDLIVGGEDVPQPKPDPAGIERALARLNITPDEAWFVGDHVVDAQAAAAAGVRCAIVLTGGTTREDLSHCRVDRFMNSLSELPALWLMEE